MSLQQSEEIVAASPRDPMSAVRGYLSGRRGLLALAMIALVAGAYFNWGWLVAAGIAPLLLTALPCAAMCALGLCMNKTATHEPQTPPQSRDSSTSGESAKVVPLRLVEPQDRTLGRPQSETSKAPRNQQAVARQS